MSERVALINGISLCFELELKQLLFLFERLGVTDVHLWEAWKPGLLKSNINYVNDFEYLQDSGQIIGVTRPNLEGQIIKLYDKDNYRALSDKIQSLRENTRIDESLNWMRKNPEYSSPGAPITQELAQFARYMNTVRHYQARLDSIALNALSDLRTIPIFPSSDAWQDCLESRRANVMHIIFNNLPIPDQSVPLQDILQFRADSQTQYFLSKIRNWASETAKGQLSPIEIQEKIEWLLVEYEHHLAINHIKTRRTVVEMLLTECFDAAESLLKFKWSKLAKQAFSIQAKKIEQLEFEMKAPGNEVGFISKARREFKS